MSKIKVPGKRDNQLRNDPLFHSDLFSNENPIDTTIDDAIKVEQKRDNIQIEETAIKEDQIVELTFNDEVTWYVNYHNLKDEMKSQRLQRGAAVEDDVISLSDTLVLDNGKRGIGEIMVKSLRVIGVDLPSMATKNLVENIEEKLEPGEGLYHCHHLNKIKKTDKFSSKKIDLNRPILIFIHGTASNTQGSFGGLMEEESKNIWHQIQDYYTPNNILTFEHKTLSKSPIENTLDLAKLLPEEATVHLITHSRGGMIGELLARARMVQADEDGKKKRYFTKNDIEVFEKLNVSGNRKKDIKALEDLNEIFEDKNINMSRIFRFACPAAGTTLASGRLDLYLNTILNLLKKITFLSASPIVDFTLSLLLSTIKNRMSPKELPGLEAMVPGSPLTRILNDPNVELDSELVIVSGSVQGGNIWNSFKVFLSNLFYREDHDFVVNTKAMFGGSRRSEKVHVFREKGGNVSHFRYFLNKSSQTALINAIKNDISTNTGFTVLERKDTDQITKLLTNIQQKRSSSIAAIEKPVVILIPEMMGSYLSKKTSNNLKRIWLDPNSIANGEIESIGLDEEKIVADGIINSAYQKLFNYLSKSYHVFPFDYDWRKPILSQTENLEKTIKKLRTKLSYDSSIKILAHGMGGLVARAYIEQNKKAWSELTENDGRLIMLGTPNNGTHAIPLLLMGKDRIIKMLHTLDLKRNTRDILQIFTKFPGLLEQLPVSNNKNADFFDTDIWLKLNKYSDFKWSVPSKNDLKEAKKLRSVFKSSLDPKYCCYIAGIADQTPLKFELKPEEKYPVRIISTKEGDGRVTWESGIPYELEKKTWYIPVEHGELCNYEPSFDGIIELLEEGSTRLISNQPNIDRGAKRDINYYVDQELEIFPDTVELEAAAVGFVPKEGQNGVTEKTIVSVAHGDLGHARFPVAVGHHLGDKIIRAERALDIYLDNQLSDRHQMGNYPGIINSNEVILDEDSNPKGAIIVGLGHVGELNENTLRSSFYHAVVSYIFKKRYDKDNKLGISSLLIGGVFSGLSIKSSIRCILSAVLDANLRIEELNMPGLYPIREFEFVEMYEDRAIQAAKILYQILEERPFNQAFKIKDYHLRRIPGVRRKIIDAPRTNWWHRLKVETEKDKRSKSENNLRMKFTSLTERARAEVSNIPTQKLIVDGLIEQAVISSKPDQSLLKAIFDLLIPNDFKRYSEDLKNILWILDLESAQYPWELMQNTVDDKQKPIAVRSGMLRQLSVSNYRTNIRTNKQISSAFVVGDTESDLAPLPGAQVEAREVDNILKNNGFSSDLKIKATPSEIITSLFEKDYQIIHLAGHGEFNPDEPQSSGMVLGKNVFLTPAIINQLMTLPELVFINCCHSGAQEETSTDHSKNYHQLAANIGTQLIKMGVSAVVVAGWAVDDTAALTFSKAFYRRLFSGYNFGEAVQKAREITYDDHPNSNTWGAYQCYGDPFFEIRPTGKSTVNIRKNYVDPVEVIIELENISNSTQAASSRNLDRNKARVDQVLSNCPKKWLKEGRVLEAIGNVYANLNEYELAIDYYEQVKSLEQSTFSLQVLEQLAKIKIKYGSYLYRRKVKGEKVNISKRDAKTLIDDGINIFQNLLNILQDTSERLNMKASGHKRMAIIEGNDPEKRRSHLSDARSLYETAYEISLKSGMVNNRALVNFARMEVILLMDENKKLAPSHKSKIIKAKAQVKQTYKEEPNFRNYSISADYCLFEILYNSVSKRKDIIELLEEQRKSYLNHLSKAWSMGGSYMEKYAVMEELDIIIELIELSTSRNKKAVLNQLKSAEYHLGMIWKE